jgi:hypothetical protein
VMKMVDVYMRVVMRGVERSVGRAGAVVFHVLRQKDRDLFSEDRT